MRAKTFSRGSGAQAGCLRRGARRVRLALVAPVVLSSVLLLMLFGASSADAQNCSLGSHCYLLDYWAPATQNEGIYANMDAECLYEANPNSTFVDEEIWESSDNSNDLAYWTELGLTWGIPWGSSGRVLFWADNRPGGGYNQHEIGSGAINTTYGLLVQWIGGDEWAVDVDGYNYGISTSNPPYSESLEGGAEFTNNADRAAAYFSGLGFYTTSGVGENYWDGVPLSVGNDGGISVSGPPQSTFANYYDGSGTCTTDAATPTASTVSGEAPDPVPSSAISSSQAAALLALTNSLAASLGDSTPNNVVAVPSTRAAANKLASGDIINGSSGQPDENGVYLVQATGTFDGAIAHVPADQPTPSGSAIWLAVDPATNSVLDWGMSPAPLTSAQLESLGTVTNLGPPHASRRALWPENAL